MMHPFAGEVHKDNSPRTRRNSTVSPAVLVALTFTFTEAATVVMLTAKKRVASRGGAGRRGLRVASTVIRLKGATITETRSASDGSAIETAWRIILPIN